jgi:hypothetical protein
MNVKKKVWLIIGFLVIIAGAYLAGCLFHGRQRAFDFLPLPGWSRFIPGQTTGSSVRLDPTAGTAINGSYQSKSHEEILADLKKQQIIVTDKLSSHAVFASGTKGTAGKWMLENVRQNNIILQAEIFAGDACIARTAPLQPGQHVESIILLEDVPWGTRQAIAYLNYFDRKTRAFISRTGFHIKLSVSH